MEDDALRSVVPLAVLDLPSVCKKHDISRECFFRKNVSRGYSPVWTPYFRMVCIGFFRTIIDLIWAV